MQGDDPVYLKASACAKHFAVHSGPEWNRHTYNAEVSDFDLWDTYLPAFKELIVDAGVTGVMCAYNAFAGQPCCGSDALMMSILKDQWHFNGYVVSDCGAIGDFYRTHKTHPDAADASADAVLHGTDCECGNSYQALAEALEKGLITEDIINASLKRLFKIRFQLGMFDPDKRVPYAETSLEVLESPAHKAHALKMAQQSIVLLKNENNLLPLNKQQIKKIAVVGPNADSESVMLANYFGVPSEITTLLEGLRAKVGSEVEVVYEKGVNLTDSWSFASDYKGELFSYEGETGFKADYYGNMRREGTPALTRIEKDLKHTWKDGEVIVDTLVARRMSVVWTSVFTPDETKEVCFELKNEGWTEFLIDGVAQKSVGDLNAYFPLRAEKGKTYNIEVVYRQFGDNGEIALDLGVLRKVDAKEVASSVKDADVIVFAGGISANVEGEEMGVLIDGFKGGDRTAIHLPSVQTELLKELNATGKPVVLVLMTGSAIGLEWESQHIPAILNAWYGGQAGGQAVADVLFGDYNPAGRLPVTFYKNTDDLPDFEDYSMENRTYRYYKGAPIYPFGYGLSYTTFQYTDLVVSPDAQSVKVTVSNTGTKDGDEVVQLYLSNQRDFRTPIRSLKGFKRIHLKAGESQTLEFALSREELSVTGVAGELEPMVGEVTVSVGGGQPCPLSLEKQTCLQTKLIING
jgi:beta-glucosidase